MPALNLKYIRGRRLSVGPAFWCMALPLAGCVLMLLAWACYFFYLSLSMLSELTGLHAILCGVLVIGLLGTLSINDKPGRGLLPPFLRSTLGRTLVWGTIGYQYAVNQWPVVDVLLLAAPTIVYSGVVLFKWIRRR